MERTSEVRSGLDEVKHALVSIDCQLQLAFRALNKLMTTTVIIEEKTHQLPTTPNGTTTLLQPPPPGLEERLSLDNVLEERAPKRSRLTIGMLINNDDDEPNAERPDHGKPPLLLTLPEELLAYILDFLDLLALLNASLVCRSVRKVAETFPWKKVYLDHRYQFLELPPSAAATDEIPFAQWRNKTVYAKWLVERWTQPPAPDSSMTLRGHTKPISSLQFRENKLLSCDDRAIKQWDLGSGKALASFVMEAGNPCYHFQIDEEHLVVSTVDAVRVYDGSTTEPLFSLLGIESYANRLKLTRDLIVGGMWDGYIHAWRFADQGRSTTKSFGHQLPIYCLDAAPDKIVSGSSDRCIKVYDAQLQLALATLKGHSMTVTALQLNDEMGCIHSGSKDKCVIRWDPRASNTPVQRWTGHADTITCSQYDGFKLVTGGMDSVVKVWDIRTTRMVYSITGNEGGVCCMQFCGPHLVFGGTDGLISIHNYAH